MRLRHSLQTESLACLDGDIGFILQSDLPTGPDGQKRWEMQGAARNGSSEIIWTSLCRPLFVTARQCIHR